MAALDKIKEMKAALQAQVDALADVETELSQVSSSAPQLDQSAMDDLKAQIDAKNKECDDLRAIIQVEIDDKKKDTSRLEAALAPIEPQPAPVVPDPAPASSDAPAASAPAAASDSASAPAASAPAADTSAPASQDASPAAAPAAGAVSLDSPL